MWLMSMLLFVSVRSSLRFKRKLSRRKYERYDRHEAARGGNARKGDGGVWMGSSQHMHMHMHEMRPVMTCDLSR